MRGSREILKDTESKLIGAFEGASIDVMELLQLAGSTLKSTTAMQKEASSVLEQVHAQAQSGRRKAKLALNSKREEIAEEALRHTIALELESERLASHLNRLNLMITELSRWHKDLTELDASLASWLKLWREKRERGLIAPTMTVLGRMMRRMIRAASILEKANETIDLIKVDIEGLERLRAEAEPSRESFGWKYKMPSDLKAKLDARLREELAKLR